MAKALKTHGPVASMKKARRADDDLKRANAFFEKGHYGPAARLYQGILEAKLKIPATETAKANLAKIVEKADKQLETARLDVADGAYREGIEKLLDLEDNFASLEAGKGARQELEKLRKLPEARAAFDALEKKTRATPKAVVARPTDDASDIDNDFFSEEELDALDEMATGEKPKPVKQPSGGSRECRRLLSLARSWIANKRPDKARELLDKIIEKHPATLYADQARGLLKKLD
jgi:tetratricopeptide (TPR) repeat protein